MSSLPVNPLSAAVAEASGAPEAPAVLLPYQQRWSADQTQLKVIEKSRRTGLTWGEAADDVLCASASKAAGGMNVYYIAYNQDMTVEYIDACAMWARAFNEVAGEIEEGFWEDGDKHIKTFSIRFPNSGHRITALTSRPSNLRGRQGRVVIDEAAFHDSLAELLKAALALLIWGGCVRVISTHNGEDNPFNELINEIRAGKRKGTVQRITFREAVAEGLYKRVCLRLGREWTQADEDKWVADVYAFYGEAATEELDCVPSKGGGTWLTHALLESRQNAAVPVLRLTCSKEFDTWTEEARKLEVADWCEEHLKPLLVALPENARSYYGLDFARNSDLSVFWPLLQGQDLVRRTPFVLEMSNVPFNQQREVLFYIVDRLPRFLGAKHDARGNGQYLAEQAVIRYGAARVEALMLSEGWYREHTPSFKAALQDGDLTDMPKDADILADHRAFKLVKGVARIPEVRTVGQSGAKRHGDSGIAHLLAWTSSRNPAAEIDYTGAKRPAPDEVADDDDDVRHDGDGAW